MVAALVCGYLRVHLDVVAQTGMGTAEHLKVGPLQPERFQLGLHVPIPDVIAPERFVWILRREHPGIRLLSHDRYPFVKHGGGG